MHSLAISLGGKYHQAVEGVLTRANDVASRDSEELSRVAVEARAGAPRSCR